MSADVSYIDKGGQRPKQSNPFANHSHAFGPAHAGCTPGSPAGRRGAAPRPSVLAAAPALFEVAAASCIQPLAAPPHIPDGLVDRAPGQPHGRLTEPAEELLAALALVLGPFRT